MQTPYKEHIEAINRTLEYLKATPSKGLRFRKTDKRCIEAYTDSNFVGSIVDYQPLVLYFCVGQSCYLEK